MKSTSNSGILDIIEYQKEQIKDLQNTKDEQFKQLSNMQNLLDQQQRQALQDKKVLEEYKEEIKGLKSLMVPVREDEKDPIAQQSKDIDNIKEAPHKKNKKWWPKIKEEINRTIARELRKLARQSGGLGEDQFLDAPDVIERLERGTAACAKHHVVDAED